jgi:hypothetical protein
VGAIDWKRYLNNANQGTIDMAPSHLRGENVVNNAPRPLAASHLQTKNIFGQTSTLGFQPAGSDRQPSKLADFSPYVTPPTTRNAALPVTRNTPSAPTVKRGVRTGALNVPAIPDYPLEKNDIGDVVSGKFDEKTNGFGATPNQPNISEVRDTNYGMIDGVKHYIPNDADTYTKPNNVANNGGALPYFDRPEPPPVSIVGSSSHGPIALGPGDPGPLDVGKMTFSELLGHNIGRRDALADSTIRSADELSNHNWRSDVTSALTQQDTGLHQRNKDYIAAQKLPFENDQMRASAYNSRSQGDTNYAESPSKIKASEASANYQGALTRRTDLQAGPEKDKILSDIEYQKWKMQNEPSREERDKERLLMSEQKNAADLRERILQLRNDPKALQTFTERFPEVDPSEFDAYVEQTARGNVPEAADRQPDTKTGGVPLVHWGGKVKKGEVTSLKYSGGALGSQPASNPDSVASKYYTREEIEAYKKTRGI